MSIHRERLTRLRAAMEGRRLDALLVSQPESRYYLSGYTGHDLPPRDSAGYLLVTAHRALLLTDARTSEQAEREAPEYEVIDYGAGACGPRKIGEVAKGIVPRKLGFEAVHLPYAIWREVRQELDGSKVELTDTDGLVDDLRAVKDADELRQLQAAIDVLDRCFAEVARGLVPGLSERQVARKVEAYLLEHADGSSFPPIVASGPHASMPHAAPTDRLIQVGEPITIDIGARVAGYCSDMTRTICLGEPADGRLREVYAIVQAAQARAERDIRPGMTGREADAVAREVIEQAGYGEAFTHGTGHGIGLEVHEPPWLSKVRGDEPLRAGMVFSIEPGIYLPSWGGVRIEDLVVLEATGPRVLSRSPKGLQPHKEYPSDLDE